MQDDLEDNQEDYCSLNKKYWCDFLSKIEVKDNKKMEATQINKIATPRAASRSDIYESVRVPHKNSDRAGV